MKIHVRGLLEYLFVIVLILNCHSVYEVGSVKFHFNAISIVLVIILLTGKNFILYPKIVYAIVWYFIFQIPIVVYAYTISNYIYVYIIKYVLYVILLLVLYSKDCLFKNKFIDIFINCMFFLAVVSLFFYVFATILHIISPSGMYYINWYPARWVRNYWGLYFEISGGHVFDYKNASIFAESPINAALLGMALDFELFYEKKRDKNIKYIIVFVLAMITTFSTGAFIVLPMSLFGVFFVNYKKICHSKLGKVFMWVVIIIIGVIAFYLALYAYNYKKNAVGESYLVRSDDYMVAFQALKDHPILGVGFGNTSYTKHYMSSQRLATGNTGQSSDFAYLLAGGGLYFFLIYILGFIGLFKYNKSVSSSLMFIAILIVIFIVSRVGATLLFISLICMGIYSLIVRQK